MVFFLELIIFGFFYNFFLVILYFFGVLSLLLELVLLSINFYKCVGRRKSREEEGIANIVRFILSLGFFRNYFFGYIFVL